MIPVMIPVTQFRSRERGKLHLRESNFTNFPGGMPPDPPPLPGVRSARPPAEPLHPVLPNATEKPGRVDSSLL